MAVDEGTTSTLRQTPLTEHGCWTLLGGSVLGRLAYVDRGRPYVVPVNHAVLGDRIVVASRPGAKLAHALRQPGVHGSFEVDWTAADGHEGWFVMASGPLTAITDRVATSQLSNTVDPSWLELARGRRWLVMDVREIHGHRHRRGG